MAEAAGVRQKGLGAVTATFLVAGNMVGSGLFLLPASLAAVGSASLIGWAITGAGAMAIAGVFAILGAVRPDPNGLVRYPADGLHPWAGFVAWAAYWASCWIGNVAIALAAVGYLGHFLPQVIGPWPTAIAAIGFIWLMTLSNLFGPRVVGWFAGSTLAVGLVPIVATIVLGAWGFDPEIFSSSWNVSGKPLTQAIPPVLVTIFWAYLGLESAAIAAKAVDNPRRNLPLATLGGVALATAVYVAATAAIMGVIPAADLVTSTAPFADVVQRLVGPIAGAIVAACALAKTVGTLSGWLLVAAEASTTGAASGYLPRAIAGQGERLPVRGVIVTAGLMSLTVLATVSPTLTKQFNALINAAVLANLTVYLLCAIALIRFSRHLGARAVALIAAAFCAWATWAFFAG